MIWTLKQLQDTNMARTCINGKWVPARPINYKYRSIFTKIREAMMVFSGKAEAFVWPE
jgi:hypothetical protein